ncbi:phosphinothricin-tripeptide synthetase I [Streptomyces viridochromogenes DSM 40736]|uniref:Phosphinothricin-tripeptide synthetase I n=2 Tax=Streptomyces viridochromogenes TaxID=1938 RepID=D9XF33_STRVT|nr:non-ribosomal peptide synthetase [Streptomyces viridochromogenes]AAU00087.1 phosphinothricin-tripeptide synthetase I [Streptomyces viridochromogenes]EFL30512.1 phosphinothricin-tripeptide synthetase I [Streptomyces viridochromogenes DSM 40736]
MTAATPDTAPDRTGPSPGACPVVAEFARRAQAGPDRPAVVLPEETVDYRELAARADAVARALLDSRGEGSEPVPLMVLHPAWMLAACLGVLKAGKYYVPLNPHHPDARNRDLLARLGAALVVTDGAVPGRLPGRITVLSVGELDVRPGTPGEPGPAVAPDQWAYALYTSGSTGLPKGILQNRADMRQNIDRHAALGIGPEDRVTLINADGFVAAVSNPYMALLNGAALVPYSFQRDGVHDLIDRLDAAGTTVYYSFPSFLRQAAAVSEGRTTDRVRLAYLGGESVHSSDVLAARRLFPAATVAVGLNSTETGLTRLRLIPPGAEVPDPVPVGGPVPGVEVRVEASPGRPAAVGEAGRIVVRSAFLHAAQWTDQGPRPLTEAVPEADSGTACEPAPRDFRTGDRGRLDGTGQLVHLGRVDGMVKVRGYRVETVEVESAVSAVTGVAEAAVVPYETAEHATELAAYVVAKDPDLTDAALRRALSETLPTHLVPSSVLLVPRLPRTRNGKIDRKALPDPASGTSGTAVSRPAPAHTPAPAPGDGPDEARARVLGQVGEIWSDVLGAGPVLPGDDFFSLGGTSISALRVVSRIRKELGVPLRLAVIFETPSLEAVAESVLRELKGT